MTLNPCYRATCDATGCRVAEMVPHARANSAARQLVALGWVVVRWRWKHPGIVRRWRGRRAPDGGIITDRDRQADVGGGPRKLWLCPSHRRWRPTTGHEAP